MPEQRSKSIPSKKKMIKGVAGNLEVGIPDEPGLIDFSVEKKRLEKELRKIKEDSEKLQRRLENKSFIQRAPEKVINETKQGLKELREKKAKLEQNLKQINDWSRESF